MRRCEERRDKYTFLYTMTPVHIYFLVLIVGNYRDDNFDGSIMYHQAVVSCTVFFFFSRWYVVLLESYNGRFKLEGKQYCYKSRCGSCNYKGSHSLIQRVHPGWHLHRTNSISYANFLQNIFFCQSLS